MGLAQGQTIGGEVMQNAKERWVLYYDKHLKPHPEEAPPIPMKEVVDLLFARQQAGESVWLIKQETAALRITDMEIDSRKETACLLVQYADTTISDPAFSNLETGQLRVEPKLDGEGVAISSHMVVSLKPTEPRGNVYLTLLEDVPGIGKTKIAPFLTAEFREVCKFTFVDESKRTRKCRPRVEMAGHVSQSLAQDLEKGVLRGFELIKYQLKEPEFDEPGYTKTEAHILKIKTRKGFSGIEAIGLINRVKEKASKADFTEMRVKYKRVEGKQLTKPVSTAREDAGDALFARLERIKLESPLPQCSQKIVEEVKSKMTKLLISQRDSKTPSV